jgi:hypothetical protein
MKTPVSEWRHKTFVPAVIVKRYGWDRVLRERCADALFMAGKAGILTLDEPKNTTVTSWVIGSDGSYIPQPADGTETFFGIEFTFDVDIQAAS